MRISSLALPIIIMMVLFGSPARAALECPIFTLGETIEDCPWADITRALSHTQNIAAEFAKLPGVTKELEKDHGEKFLKTLWGDSINYDEGAKAIIVQPQILDYLTSKLGVPARKDKIVHAGLEHTYGYLFSNLKTPFGYKRARWVRDDIEKGFRLPRGTLGPYAQKGSFFSNVTVFLSQIAFRTEADLAKEALEKSSRVSMAVFGFDFKRLGIKRIEETVEMHSRKVVLRTDLVSFLVKGLPTDNSHLLVYSYLDSDKSTPLLITAFPVNQAFVDQVLKPENFGHNLPVTTRYNAQINGITGVTPPLLGTREIK